MSSTANDWVERLVRELGLDPNDFATRGIVELRFEGDVAVAIERSPAGDALLLHVALARIDGDTLAHGAVFEELLIMNHAGNNPLGMILAVDESDGELVLSHSVSTVEPAEYDDLVEAMQQVIARTQAVQVLLDEAAQATRNGPPPASRELLINPNLLV